MVINGLLVGTQDFNKDAAGEDSQKNEQAFGNRRKGTLALQWQEA